MCPNHLWCRWPVQPTTPVLPIWPEVARLGSDGTHRHQNRSDVDGGGNLVRDGREALQPDVADPAGERPRGYGHVSGYRVRVALRIIDQLDGESERAKVRVEIIRCHDFTYEVGVGPMNVAVNRSPS